MKKVIVLVVLGLAFFTGVAQIPTDSLVLYYPFNGDAKDYTKDSIHGTAYGVTPTTGRFGAPNTAYDFDGVNDYITVPDTSAIRPQFPFAISIWLKTDSFNAKFISLYKSCDSKYNYSGFSINYSPTGQISAGIGNGGAVSTYNRRSKLSDSTLTLGVWQHLVASFKAPSDISIYIDGVDAGGAYSGNATYLGYTSDPGVIGLNAAPSGDFYHNGKIDDVRIYTDTLGKKDAKFLSFESNCTYTINLYDTIVVLDSVPYFDTIPVVDTIPFYVNTSVVDTLIIDVPIGINEVVLKSLKVYPNPATDRLTINFGDAILSDRKMSILISDETGKEILHQKVNTSVVELDLSELVNSGNYFLNVLDESGTVLQTIKLLLIND